MEINDKLKQILKEQSEDFKGYVGTLAEDFHQVKLIGEQYVSIIETLDAHTADIASIKETQNIRTHAYSTFLPIFPIHLFYTPFQQQTTLP